MCAPKGAGGVVGQRIARQDRGDAGIDRHGERVDGAVGIGDGIDAGALGRGGHGHHLRGSEHLAEALVLDEVEGALAAVVDVGKKTGPPLVNPNSLRRKGGMRPG